MKIWLTTNKVWLTYNRSENDNVDHNIKRSTRVKKILISHKYIARYKFCCSSSCSIPTRTCGSSLTRCTTFLYYMKANPSQ